MTENDRMAFYELLDFANELTIMPNGKNLERMKKVLFLGLAEYPLKIVAEAVNAHCRANKFFPMLADIISQIEGSLEDRAALAWSLILKAKRKYRRDKGLRFPVPAIHYAIEKMGGWDMLYWSINDENEAFKAKEFLRFYRIGERCASWDEEPGKTQVCSYFPSDDEVYALKKGRTPKREIYDVDTDMLITGKIKILYALPYA